jgi:tetratricopeptide (TPR) repeat protein
LALVVGVGAYVVGHMDGSAVPGITGTPTTSPSASAGGLDEAKIAEYMQAITANPKDAIALWNLGNIYFDVQDYKNALTFYVKLTAVSPKDANVWIAAGAAAFNQGLDAEAFEYWTQATQADPKNVEAHYNLGFWYLSQQPSQELKAKAEWETVVSMAPDSDFAKTVQQHLDQLGEPSASK